MTSKLHLARRDPAHCEAAEYKDNKRQLSDKRSAGKQNRHEQTGQVNTEHMGEKPAFTAWPTGDLCAKPAALAEQVKPPAACGMGSGTSLVVDGRHKGWECSMQISQGHKDWPKQSRSAQKTGMLQWGGP